MSITISKNGTATVKYYGSLAAGGQIDTSYRGKYRNPLPDGDGGYLLIKGNKIYKLDENKNYYYDCMGDGEVCVSAMHR